MRIKKQFRELGQDVTTVAIFACILALMVNEFNWDEVREVTVIAGLLGLRRLFSIGDK